MYLCICFVGEVTHHCAYAVVAPASVCVCVYVYVYVYACMNDAVVAPASVCAYVHECNTYIHKYVYVHAYTHTHKQADIREKAMNR